MGLINKLTAIANKIRSKTEKQSSLTLNQMAEEIDSLIYAQTYSGEVVDTYAEE